jgi:YjbE family integral membrane protein
MEMLVHTDFWIGLGKIIWVNLLLSGDNAVVIALAARSLPPAQQKMAVFWGAGAAVIMRIILTIFAVALLTLPWLKIVGGLLLLWIGIKLLVPEDDGDDIASSDNLFQAIKTILIADLVMSLDNVLAVAAAADSAAPTAELVTMKYTLLVLGLAISIPIVIFGSTLMLKFMERWPVIITIGAALLGWSRARCWSPTRALECALGRATTRAGWRICGGADRAARCVVVWACGSRTAAQARAQAAAESYRSARYGCGNS